MNREPGLVVVRVADPEIALDGHWTKTNAPGYWQLRTAAQCLKKTS
jgi:hypothetical protein